MMTFSKHATQQAANASLHEQARETRRMILIKSVQPVPKVTLVENIPTPYRVPVFNRVAADPRLDFTAIFCAEREPNRQWDLGPLSFRRVFLKERFTTTRDG